jgi:hypothetical protein
VSARSACFLESVEAPGGRLSGVDMVTVVPELTSDTMLLRHRRLGVCKSESSVTCGSERRGYRGGSSGGCSHHVPRKDSSPRPKNNSHHMNRKVYSSSMITANDLRMPL